LRTSYDLDRGSFAEFLLAGNDNLLVAVQARANFDFIANGWADFDAPGVNALAVGVI
jgi:hypothetical protein